MPEADWHQARRLAYEAGSALAAARREPELVPLAQAAGRVLAQDIHSLHTMPHYASSAMDGWAVAGEGPWQVERPREDSGDDAEQPRPPAGAGSTPSPLEPGRARAIVTGESVPEGATAVLRQEASELEAATGTLSTPDAPAAGADIRPAGREAAEGELLLRAGTRLTPGRIAVVAVGGHDQLPVASTVRIRLLLTGDEVVTAGIPAPGQVRDTFGPVLPGCIEALGGVVADVLRIGDDAPATRDALDSDSARGADVVLSTGGTGHSPADHVRPVAEELGGTSIVGSVAMRPGHPALLRGLPGGRLLGGLPGNPLAAFMAVVTLLEPLLQGANGQPPSAPVAVGSL
ncbi:MAG: molybdopterin molybdotransferase MoeA, partial [Micrococcaceae bacterium]|nr:molybdopterin molybdotransferase MoeA [Micrococcaceae bacterium]